MIDIYEYIKETRDFRTTHLDLSSNCIERGGSSYEFRGLLAHIIGTTIPIRGSKVKILLCHACHNAKCSNPYHLYWGTNAENLRDSFNSGTRLNPYGYNVRNHGVEYANSVNKQSSEIASKAGKANKGKPKSPGHKQKISESLNRHYRSKIDQ